VPAKADLIGRRQPLAWSLFVFDRDMEHSERGFAMRCKVFALSDEAHLALPKHYKKYIQLKLMRLHTILYTIKYNCKKLVLSLESQFYSSDMPMKKNFYHYGLARLVLIFKRIVMA
jgi:hypothetical protein